jgi:hypothetical protein
MKLADRVKMSVSGTPGTGTITLGSAASAAQTFASAGVVNGDIVRYVAVDGAAWEIGWGLYTSSGTSLTRNLIASSTGSLISLTSAAVISISPAAADANYSGMKNRLINGDMRIDQRNAGASGTSSAYTVDRWFYNASQASKGTWGQNLNAVTPPANFSNYLGFQSSSAYTAAAGDLFGFFQAIEGFNWADLGWGSSAAQAVTLGFWVYSSLTGTFGGAVKNYAGTRSYPFTYSIGAANTWTFIVVTIPGDTSGTWVGASAAGALYLNLSLGTGSTYSGTAGSWASANYASATGAVSVVGTNAATFYLTGVQLEPGSTPTSFERRDFPTELIKCQRYYFKTYEQGTVPGAVSPAKYPVFTMINGSANYYLYPLPVQMRAAPTVTFYAYDGTVSNWLGTSNFAVSTGIAAAGYVAALGTPNAVTVVGHIVCTAEI